MNDLQITVSVFGRFHAFDLAQQLQEAGVLRRLITTYPRFVAKRWGLPSDMVSPVLTLELFARICAKLPLSTRWQRGVRVLFCEHFDQAASRRLLESSNVFVGWSSYSLQTIRKAKSLGMKTVVERGSSHIDFQTDILKDEYCRWGRVFTATPARIRDRELQEYAEADRIAVPSYFAKQSFVNRGIAIKKLLHVPYGVSLKEFFPVPRNDNVFRIIYCGSLSFRKGIPYLLKAFYELNLPNAELWLVGSVDPELKDVLATYRRDNIVLKGPQPQNTLRWFYSQCSAFCLFSIEEGFGMVIPQAMASGLPVIYSPHTGGPDIINDNVEGFEVPIRDIETLKSRILFLYENPQVCREMGERARQKALSVLSWKQYGALCLDGYRKLLAETIHPMS